MEVVPVPVIGRGRRFIGNDVIKNNICRGGRFISIGRRGRFIRSIGRGGRVMGGSGMFIYFPECWGRCYICFSC